MIITKHFIMLLFPKTGTGFAADVIRVLYHKHHHYHDQRDSLNLLNPPIEGQQNLRVTQHGGYIQIPAGARHVSWIYSTLRNIYRLLISEYGYLRWQAHWIEHDQAVRHFPGFPDIGFDRFLDFSNHVMQWRLRHIHNNSSPPTRLGVHSYRFLLMFCRDPFEVLGKIDDAYIESGEWLKTLCPVKFLQQHRLNDDLRAILKHCEIPQHDLDNIHPSLMHKINIRYLSKYEHRINQTIEYDADSEGWKVDIGNFLHLQEKAFKESSARLISLFPEVCRSVTDLDIVEHSGDLKSELIRPDERLIERVERDEQILFRFIRENDPQFHGNGAWDIEALTGWPRGD